MSKTSAPRLLAFILFLFLSSNVVGQDLEKVDPELVGASSSRLLRLSNTLDTFVKDGKLPGTVTLILKNGKVVFEHANGMRDLESGDPMEATDIFRIASQTKAIVSAGVLLLQEEGKLIVTAPLSRYLPEFKNTSVAVANEEGYEIVPAKRQITVRDLLTHTAGIGYGYGPASELWKEAEIQGWYFAHRSEPIRETVRRMASLPMDRQPGEAFVYGYNTDILGALIEVVSGMPLDRFLKERIFDPVGMEDTHFYLPAEKMDRLSVVYGMKDGKLERSPNSSNMGGQGEYASGPKVSFSGGAGLLSTAQDYARFLQMIMNEGAYNGVHVLSPASVSSMLSDHIGHLGRTNGTGFGLGFQVIKDPGAFGALSAVGEYSWGGAYHSNYFASPEQQMVVVYFTQLSPTGSIDDHAKLRALSYQAMLN